MTDDESNLGEQAAAEGDDTLADFVNRDAYSFQAHLDHMEAQTNCVWANAGKLESHASLVSAVATTLRVATFLGTVEGLHLLIKFW